MVRRPNSKQTKSLRCCHGRLFYINLTGVQVNCFTNQSLRRGGHYTVSGRGLACGRRVSGVCCSRRRRSFSRSSARRRPSAEVSAAEFAVDITGGTVWAYAATATPNMPHVHALTVHRSLCFTLEIFTVAYQLITIFAILG